MIEKRLEAVATEQYQMQKYLEIINTKRWQWIKRLRLRWEFSRIV